MKAALACLELGRTIGNSAPMRAFSGPEVMPCGRKGLELERFVRDAILPQWHQSGTARMGRDASAVVDARLKVYGIGGLTVADGSVFPRVPTGNTMAPCVIVGERAGDILKAEHGA